jgi:hypothetical protein
MNNECLKLARKSSKISSNIFYNRVSFIKNLLVKWQNYDDVDKADMDINNSGYEDEVNEMINIRNQRKSHINQMQIHITIPKNQCNF